MMGHAESVAKRVMEAVIDDAEMRYRQAQHDGSHDYDLYVGGEPAGIVEVTAAADQRVE